MMMSNIMKNLSNLQKGTIVEGKWHRNRYYILNKLGSGATGTVYLAARNNRKVALKLSENSMSITSEVNVLKSIPKVQGCSLGPSFIDADDWVSAAGKIPFYVMEYIEGPDFLTFARNKGMAWMEVLIIQLLGDLQKLHERGWIFGDLKPENLIVTGPSPRIRCIDVGGITLIGRAVKEYTEFYDRGYWGLGSRKAEPSYDLFSVAMLMLNCGYPRRFRKKSGGIEELKEYIMQQEKLRPYKEILLRAFQGGFKTAGEMREALLNRTYKGIKKDRARGPAYAGARGDNKKRKRKKRRVETFLIFFIISSLYIFYLIGQLM